MKIERNNLERSDRPKFGPDDCRRSTPNGVPPLTFCSLTIAKLLRNERLFVLKPQLFRRGVVYMNLFCIQNALLLRLMSGVRYQIKVSHLCSMCGVVTSVTPEAICSLAEGRAHKGR